MTDLLQAGSQWLTSKMQSHASCEVVYCRGVHFRILNATVGRTVLEIESTDGLLERLEVRDYLIPAAGLIIDGMVTLPQRGDQIRQQLNGTVYIYEVMAPGDEPHYRLVDRGTMLRIHTKSIDTERAG